MQLSEEDRSSSGSRPRRDQVSGADSGGVPPVPIPNTAVKTASADGSRTAGSLESRTVPDYTKNPSQKCGGFSLSSEANLPLAANICSTMSTNAIDLTERQEALVIGSLLGDGAMRCKRNALLEINHCADQRAYVDWKFRELSEFVGTPPKERSSNGSRRAYRFTTRSVPQLTTYFRRFYPEGRKIVPPLELAPLTLAVWFMDDGSRSYNTMYLNTQQFTVAEQVALLQMLEAQWNVKGSLNRDKQYFRIRLAVESAARFEDIIEPFVLPDFKYKLPSLSRDSI